VTPGKMGLIFGAVAVIAVFAAIATAYIVTRIF
jgi:hypothetical protein